MTNPSHRSTQQKELGFVGDVDTIICPYCYKEWAADGGIDDAPFKNATYNCYFCEKAFLLSAEPVDSFYLSSRRLPENEDQ